MEPSFWGWEIFEMWNKGSGGRRMSGKAEGKEAAQALWPPGALSVTGEGPVTFQGGLSHAALPTLTRPQVFFSF